MKPESWYKANWTELRKGEMPKVGDTRFSKLQPCGHKMDEEDSGNGPCGWVEGERIYRKPEKKNE